MRTWLMLSLLAGAFACGPREKDCFRWVYDSDENDYVKDKTFCDDCCKVCGASQHCGDTCISSNNTCHTGNGCACNRL